jgi:hypothetical protein
MTLQKGFLRKPFAYQDLSLSKHHVWMYAGIWLTGSIVIFFLLITIKESYRFISYTSVVGEVFTLSKSEAGFFSFFYACLACFFSFSLVVSHILSRPSALKEVKSYRKRAILNNLSGYQGYFIFWYFKMAVFWGILNFVIPVFLFISFSQEYTYPCHAGGYLLELLVNTASGFQKLHLKGDGYFHTHHFYYCVFFVTTFICQWGDH